jgi:NhaA family Na+:H+ antiporter
VISKIRDFLRLEAAGGIVLLCATVMAVVIVNSPLRQAYLNMLSVTLWGLPHIFFVNDGLMSIFFLFVGLELKREFLVGELAGISKIALPGAAAIGGMLVPAIIYVYFNRHVEVALQGWAIPVATDIAFALGVLSLFGKRVPLSLKLFLLALAVMDDLGAIVIIAIFYSHGFSLGYLLLACFVLFLLWMLNRVAKVTVLFPYLLLGMLLWVCVWRSGIHASISGVMLAMMIPLRGYPKRGTRGSLLKKLESGLHPYVVFLIMPLFAFCNAGLSFKGITWVTLKEPMVLGIAAGLFIGKQVGVLTFVGLMIKLGFAKWPKAISGLDMYGVALLCGIGFTMSLFLGTLAFDEGQTIYLMQVRLGVFLGSILSALCGVVILHMAFLKKQKGGSH